MTTPEQLRERIMAMARLRVEWRRDPALLEQLARPMSDTEATRLCDYAWRLICRAYTTNPRALARQARRRYSGVPELPPVENRQDMLAGLTTLWTRRPPPSFPTA